MTVLAWGTREPNDICWYPRSRKMFWRGAGVIGRIETLDYWDGEELEWKGGGPEGSREASDRPGLRLPGRSLGPPGKVPAGSPTNPLPPPGVSQPPESSLESTESGTKASVGRR